MKAVLRGSGWRHPPATIEPLRSLYLELSGLRLHWLQCWAGVRHRPNLRHEPAYRQRENLTLHSRLANYCGLACRPKIRHDSISGLQRRSWKSLDELPD